MSQNLIARWNETVRRHGPRTALFHAATGERITFRELDEGAVAWARQHEPQLAGLRGRGVVFALPNGSPWFTVLLGLCRAGAIAVPVDAAEPLAARRLLADSLRAGALWDHEKLIPLTVSRPRRYREPNATLIKLTSGSTGSPRPLLFSDDELIADAEQLMKTMRIASSDLNYALIPFGHSYGLGNLALPLLIAGVATVCGSSPLPHGIAADFDAWTPTVFPGVPALFRGLAATEGLVLPSLRLALSAGAPLAVDVAVAFERRFGTRIHSFYGSSETGGIAYDRDGSGALTGSVGTAIEGVTLSLLSGQRLCVSSPAVITAGNRKRVNRLGAFVMADRVSVNERGLITLLGRRGTTVKISGRRVELTEVATRIRRLAGVSDVWVGVSDGTDPVLGVAVTSERSTR